MEKSYNQRWKESGTTLSYKEWRRREDDKMASFTTPSLQNNPAYQKTVDDMKKAGGYKETTSGKTTFGINNSVLVIGGLIVVGAIGFVVYKKIKKNG
jgi:LPXTG-motif cell wall-anchored protein